jgi:hypothetical protein
MAATKSDVNNLEAVFTFFLLFMKHRQEVAPVILKQPGSHWSAMMPKKVDGLRG